MLSMMDWLTRTKPPELRNSLNVRRATNNVGRSRYPSFRKFSMLPIPNGRGWFSPVFTPAGCDWVMSQILDGNLLIWGIARSALGQKRPGGKLFSQLLNPFTGNGRRSPAILHTVRSSHERSPFVNATSRPVH